MKVLLPVLVVFIALIGIVIVFLANNKESEGNTFTMSEIQAANSLDTKCLAVYEGDVYEIPASWGRQHPGGSQYIASICGQDMTQMFGDQHANSARALGQLSEFKVGKLAE